MNVAIIDAYHQFHFEILEKLITKSGITIQYLLNGEPENFHGDLTIINSIKSRIIKADTIQNSVNDFLFQDNLIKLAQEPLELTTELIVDCKYIESISTRLMDRSSLPPISAFNRKRNYLLILNYFNNILQKNSIDCLIAFDTPHSFFSVVIFELAKKYNINVIRLEYHFLPNYSLLLQKDNVPSIPITYKPNYSVEQYESELDKDILNSFHEENLFLKSYKSKETKAIVSGTGLGEIKLSLKLLDKKIKNLIMGLFPFLFKDYIPHFTSLNNIRSKLEYRITLNKHLTRLVKFNKLYNKLANPNIDLNCNYIFFGMHMQPEKTSQPLGGEFDNQLFAINMLAQSLPTGWKLFVKEHPNQFNLRKVVNVNYRDEDFYYAIKKIPNVELVPLSLDSEELIANAKMVSTLTGTLGWEAIKLGIPCIVFGDAYYQACGAVRKPTSVESCKKAITELEQLSKLDIQLEAYRYLAFMIDNNYLIKASNWESNISHNTLSREDQLENITNAINTLLQKQLVTQ